jgi:hypothetical protein
MKDWNQLTPYLCYVAMNFLVFTLFYLWLLINQERSTVFSSVNSKMGQAKTEGVHRLPLL